MAQEQSSSLPSLLMCLARRDARDIFLLLLQMLCKITPSCCQRYSLPVTGLTHFLQRAP